MKTRYVLKLSKRDQALLVEKLNSPIQLNNSMKKALSLYQKYRNNAQVK